MNAATAAEATAAASVIKTEIAEYSATAAALADLQHRMAGVVYPVTTTLGMAAAVKDRAELRKLRVDLDKKRVEIKAPALERCRLIDAEAKTLTAALVELESPIDFQIKAEEARKEAEKQAKINAEIERVAKIQARINDIRLMAEFDGLPPSTIVATKLREVTALEVGGDYAELVDDARTVRDATVERLRRLYTERVAAEEQAEQIERDRQELAKLRAEEEKRAAEQERQDAERRAEQKRVDDAAEAARQEQIRKEREEFDRQQAALKAQQEEVARREAAIAQEERERKEAAPLADSRVREFAHEMHVCLIELVDAFGKSDTVRLAGEFSHAADILAEIKGS